MNHTIILRIVATIVSIRLLQSNEWFLWIKIIPIYICDIDFSDIRTNLLHKREFTILCGYDYHLRFELSDEMITHTFLCEFVLHCWHRATLHCCWNLPSHIRERKYEVCRMMCECTSHVTVIYLWICNKILNRRHNTKYANCLAKSGST